jgi:ATP-dependent Zn protease
MKFSVIAIAAILTTDHVVAFTPSRQMHAKFSSSSSALYAFGDMPPAGAVEVVKQDLPVIQQNPYGQPTDVRYSDFLKLVNADRVEKVTFSADGTQLLGVDVDGARVKIEALPNDPELLNSLTTHKVSYTKKPRLPANCS